MKEILLVSIPVIGTAVIPSILTYLTNKKIKTLDNVKKEFEDKMEANRQEDIARHQETLEKLAELEKNTDKNDIDAIRVRMSSFGNLCRIDYNNDGISKEQYISFFKDEDKWNKYHKKYPDLNGELKVLIKYVHDHYEKAEFK